MKIIQILKWSDETLLALGDNGQIFMGEFYVPDGNSEIETAFRWVDALDSIPDGLVEFFKE